MRQILAHATESPQEAEELGARLRAAGVEVEVREIGAGITVGMLEAPRRAWELWVDDSAEAAAGEVVTKALAEFEAQGPELEKELEAEALASAPPPGESAPPPEPKPVKVVTRNARIAGALLVADIFIGLGARVFDSITADPLPIGPSSYVYWVVHLIIAVALWNGSRGARMMAMLWVTVSGVYDGFGYLDAPRLLTVAHFTELLALLLLLVGGDSAVRRVAGAGLWAITTVVTLFPLTLAPSKLTDDTLVGTWRRPRTQEEIAFCADGRYFTGYPVFSTGGKWARVQMHQLSLTAGSKVERHVYLSRTDHLSLFGQGWDRIFGESPCDAPAK